MRDAHQAPVRARGPLTRSGSPTGPLGFGHDTAFQLALRRRVAEYFDTTGQRPRDCWQMYVKTAVPAPAASITRGPSIKSRRASISRATVGPRAGYSAA